jgi:hypothetical protein
MMLFWILDFGFSITVHGFATLEYRRNHAEPSIRIGITTARLISQGSQSEEYRKASAF